MDVCELVDLNGERNGNQDYFIDTTFILFILHGLGCLAFSVIVFVIFQEFQGTDRFPTFDTIGTLQTLQIKNSHLQANDWTAEIYAK